MAAAEWIAYGLGAAAILAVLTTYPYVATAISFRHRDNGLSYILLVMGVALWNGMFAAQLLSPRALVDRYFFSLAILGALLAGLGWLLFAGTASSTPSLPRSSVVYGLAATLVGLDVVLVVTSPVHELIWRLPANDPVNSVFASIDPTIGYWLHTLLLGGLFAIGTILFGRAWRAGVNVPYSRAYTITGSAVVIAVVVGNMVAPGGLTVASIVAVGLTTTGWIQAHRGRVLESIRTTVLRWRL